MKKIISVLTVMLILLASVWVMLPAVAASLPLAPDFGAEDVGGCLSHDFNDWSTPIPATCTVASYKTRSCKICGFVDLEKVAEANGHNRSTYTFDEATASHTFTCETCGETITETCTLVLEGAPVPECANAVTNTYRCTVCNNTLTRTEVPAHEVDEWTTVNGTLQHTGVCKGCEQTVYEDCAFEEISATGNCENGGARTLVCKCGRTNVESIPAGHNMEDWIHIEGTSLHAGKCTTCLITQNLDCVVDKYIVNPINATNPEATHTGTCTICNAEFSESCEPGTYANATGTASHQTNCVDCGRNFTGMCVADENGWIAGNNGTHSATCVPCKSVFSLACTPTGYTHVEDTETHSTACSECGGAYTEACEVKTWLPSDTVSTAMIEIIADNGDAGNTENITDGDVPADNDDNNNGNSSADGTNKADDATEGSDKNETAKDAPAKNYTHKGYCEKCNAEYEKDCSVETWTLNIANKTCTGTCKECGRTLSHTSTLGAWKYDAEKNSHSVECTTCKTSASHTVVVAENGWKHVEKNGAHSHEAVCTVCTTSVTSACEFEDDTTNLHKHSCKVCAFSYEDECAAFEKDKTNSTDPTCTEDGYTYYVCSVCGKRNDAQTREYKALGHDFEVDKKAEITSTDDSHTVTYVCKNEGCDITETKTEKHTFGKAKADKDGKHIVECTVCGKTKTENCKPVKIPAVAADCTNAGLTEGSKCSECGAVLKEQTKTSAKGHDYKYSSTTATCAKAGKDIFKCVCGETKEVDAAANGKHEWKVSNRVAATASANGYVEYKCQNCTETYREVLTYSVKTGVGNALSPVAAVILLSGAAFIGVKKLRKEED